MITTRLRRWRDRLIGRKDTEWYVAQGLVLGRNVHLGGNVQLDPSHCWLISIGDDTTLAPDVTVLAHDASTKIHLDLTYIAPVEIGARVFIGAGTIILPGVTIGNDAVVGAGSLVTKDVPPKTVVLGSPAHVVSTLDEFLAKHHERMETRRVYDGNDWTALGGITPRGKARQRREVASAGGYVE